jgi:hypothetical protein
MAQRRTGGSLLAAMADPPATESTSEPERPPQPAPERPPQPAPERPSQPAPATPTAQSRWTGGRIAMIVVGTLLALIALGALVSGAYGLWLYTTQRTDGYVMTSSERFSTGGYALATRTLQISSDVPSFLYGRDWLGDVRIRGHSANPSRALFIGIARKDDVDRYLAGVAHTEVTDVNANPFGTTYHPSYRQRPGRKPASPPNSAAFWVARVSGPGTQSLTWSVKQGRWAVVVMRPDGSRGVVADLAAGAKLPALLWASIGLFVIGLLIMGGAATLIYFGGREPRVPAASDA